MIRRRIYVALSSVMIIFLMSFPVRAGLTPLGLEITLSDKMLKYLGSQNVTKIKTHIRESLIANFGEYYKHGNNKIDVLKRWNFLDGRAAIFNVNVSIGLGQEAEIREKGKNTFRFEFWENDQHGNRAQINYEDSEYWLKPYPFNRRFRTQGRKRSISAFTNFLQSPTGQQIVASLYDSLADRLVRLENEIPGFTRIKFKIPEIALPEEENYHQTKLRYVPSPQSPNAITPPRYSKRKSTASEWFEEKWPLVSNGDTFSFELRRLKQNGYFFPEVITPIHAKGNRVRSQNHSNPEIELRCPVSGNCCILKTTPDDWASGKKCADTGWISPFLKLNFLGTAHAAQPNTY